MKKNKKTLNIHLGRNNLSATIFVPSDCTNNCKFCTSKESYHKRKPNLEKVLKKIKKLNKIDWIHSFVLTGGEPFADLDILQKILDTISSKKQVYVNTTLPTNRYTENELANFINGSRIDCINLSRHCDTSEKDKMFFSEYIAQDHIVSKLKKPVKVNSIIKKDTNIKKVLDRWCKYSNVFVSFRADYRDITKASLKDLQDDITLAILNTNKVKYLSHGGCDVCFDVNFCYKDTFYFSYHRGMEHSSILFGDELIINDVLVSQDGKLYYDWNQNKDVKLHIKKKQFIVYKNIE